ncbi:MAG TPA: methyltransferase domain-containing protein [Anaerolineae bacterium]|nr:methyltransferase domain-containing protein [Anaerolineae bacterium]
MPVFDHFHLIAPFYDRIFACLRTDRLRALLGLPVSGWLLDVGGGTGRVAQALRGSDQVVILDVSVGMLRQARNKGLLVVQGEAEALPFRRETFARILMVDTFHHLRNQNASAAELLRVLARGGRLVLEEFDIERLLIKLAALGERLLLMRSHFHSHEVLRRMFEAAGGRVRVERGTLNLWLIVEGGLEGT